MGVRAVIRAGRMLTAPGHAPPLGPSALTIADGRIIATAPLPADVLTPAEADTLLMPALANAHDHGRGLRPLACGVPDGPLEEWLPQLARMPRVDPYLNAAVAFARMAESGIAAANHCHNTQDGAALLAEAEAVSHAARDVGIAVAFAWPFFDRNPLAYGEMADILPHMAPQDRTALAARTVGMRSLETNLALMERAQAFEHAQFRLQYAPVAPQWVQPATLAAIARRSAEDGRRVHMHLLETRRQREHADAAWPGGSGGGLIAWLDGIGLLSPRLTVAHGVWLRADECARLAERGVTVSVNGSSNLRLRSGAAPLETIRASGLGYGIGLDGMSLDDDEDMLRELRLLGLAGARGAGDPAGPPPADLCDAALVTGRRTIVGDDGGGTLRPGAPADILALDYAALARDRVSDVIDPLSLVLGRATRAHVRGLWVAGRQVVRDGICVTIDAAASERELVEQARAAHRATPPDEASIARTGAGIARFYAAGGHCRGP